ncbi:hypothetical protein BN903_47 [Halorubrum sp. AJ67]|nr:hypothetical protein BN903_47 [Halorubrum sp. AJ67]
MLREKAGLRGYSDRDELLPGSTRVVGKRTGRDSRERSERESGRGTTERSAPAEI